MIIRGSFGLCVSPVLEEILDGGEQEGEEVRERERHQHEAEVDQHLRDHSGILTLRFRGIWRIFRGISAYLTDAFDTTAELGQVRGRLGATPTLVRGHCNAHYTWLAVCLTATTWAVAMMSSAECAPHTIAPLPTTIQAAVNSGQ